MKAVASALVLSLALGIPAGAATSPQKAAMKQCKVEYKEAKKQAGTLKTHNDRVAAKREAKANYKQCLDTAKHK